MSNKLTISIIISIAITFFLMFIKDFDLLSFEVFHHASRRGYISSPYFELFIGIVWFLIILLLFIIKKDKRYISIWLIKGGLITSFLMFFYEAKYGLDAYHYAATAFKDEFIPFGQNGTYNIIYINRILTEILAKSYYSLKIFYSFIGFIGLLFIYKTYEYIMKKVNLKIDNNFIYLFFLFPTIIFWSSILGKDPLNLFFIGLFSYAFIHLIDTFKIRYILMIVISIWFVSYIRSWWSIIMVTSIFLYYLKINTARNFILFLLIIPIFAFLGMGFLKTQGIDSFDQVFLKMSETSKNLAYGGSSLGVHVITGLGDYVLWFLPNLFTSLFRPMPWDIRNAFTLIAAIENIVLFYLFYKYIFKSWKLIYTNKYLKFYILLIFSWSLLYVIISPTNLGMAVRFKLQVLPLMLILIGVSKAMYEQKSYKNIKGK